MNKRIFILGGITASVFSQTSNSSATASLKKEAIAFVGGSGINVAKCFSELPIKPDNMFRFAICDHTFENNENDSLFDVSLRVNNTWGIAEPASFDARVASAKRELEHLRSIMQSQFNSITIVSALDGATGTFAGSALLEIALEEGINTRLIRIIPFLGEREGELVHSSSMHLLRQPGFHSGTYIFLKSQDAAEDLGVDVKSKFAMDLVNSRAAATIANMPFSGNSLDSN